MDWDKASDQEILDQLRRAELADKLERSEEWQLVREAMQRTHDKHVLLLRKADPTDTNSIVQLQQICNMYAEDFLPQLIRNFQNIGEFAFDEAKRRGILGRLADALRGG